MQTRGTGPPRDAGSDEGASEAPTTSGAFPDPVGDSEPRLAPPGQFRGVSFCEVDSDLCPPCRIRTTLRAGDESPRAHLSLSASALSESEPL